MGNKLIIKSIRTLLAWGFLFMTMNINAQNLDDALRYSYLNIQGTASGTSTGNAFNALGADFTASAMNPAGIAGFRKSYFLLTPAYMSVDTKSHLRPDAISSYSGDIHEENSNKFAINNIGLVFSSRIDDSKWRQSNLAIGLTKLANFNESFYYSGNTIGSITERFVGLANGKSVDELDQFEALPAWETYTINPGNDSVSYISDIAKVDASIYKEQSVVRTGSMNELSIGWGGNYDDKLSVGFSVGVPFVDFEEVKFYEESDQNGEHSVFENLAFKEYLSTSGVGLNLKAGMNYILHQYLRVGFAIQSPTWMILSDEYYTDLTYNDNPEHKSPIGNFKYKMATPWSATGSIGTLFRSGKWRGFLNLDVDIKDYKNNRFNLIAYAEDEASETRFQDELNSEIDSQLGFGVSYRIGGEIAYSKVRLRLGYGAIASPYEIDGSERNKSIYSIGTGYRWNNMYIDYAYQYSEKEEGYTPYVLDHATDRNQLVSNTSQIGQSSITLGFNF